MYVGRFTIEDLLYNKLGFELKDVFRCIKEMKLQEDQEYCDLKLGFKMEYMKYVSEHDHNQILQIIIMTDRILSYLSMGTKLYKEMIKEDQDFETVDEDYDSEVLEGDENEDEDDDGGKEA